MSELALLLADGLPLDDPVTRGGAREAAARELARPAYHQDDPSLLQRVADWIGRRLSGALDTLTQAPRGAVGLLLVALLALLVVVVVRLRLGRVPVRDLLGERTAGVRGRTVAEHRAEAERLAAEGRWAEALRARTRAVVRELEDRGLVEPRPGRTASGIAREAGAASPAAREDSALVARLFEEVWYGGRPATEGDVVAAREADARLRRARLALGAGTVDGTAPASLVVPR